MGRQHEPTTRQHDGPAPASARPAPAFCAPGRGTALGNPPWRPPPRHFHTTPRRHSTRQRDNTATRRHADATGRGHAGRTTYTRARPRRDAPTGPTASHQPSGAPMAGPLFPPPSPAPLPNPARGVNFALACLPTTGARTARHPFAVSSRTSRQGAASTRPSLAATGGVLRRQTRAGRTTHTHKHIYERDETDQQAQWGDHPSLLARSLLPPSPLSPPAPALLASHSRIAFSPMCHVSPDMSPQQQQPRKRVASAGAGAGGRAAGDEQLSIQFGQQPAVPCLACKKCDHNHLTHDCPFFDGEDREEDSALRKASLESSADGGGKDVSGCPIQPALICPISSHPLAAVAATCRCM